MKHLDDHTAIDLIEGRGDTVSERHATECARCRGRVADLRRLLGALATAAEPLHAVPAHLTRWAQACVRTGELATRRPRLLDRLAFGAQPVAAVRGGAMTSALYGDREHQVDLQFEAGERAPYLHGQVVPVDAGDERQWDVAVITTGGEVHTTRSDADGEFRIQGLESWHGLSLIAASGKDRLVIPRIGNGGSCTDE
jgi:hypothetical protein